MNSLTAAITAAGITTASAARRHLSRKDAPDIWAAVRKTTPAAAGSLIVAATAKSTRAARRAPPSATVSPPSISPIISVSLWADETALKRASGLSTPSQSAIPALAP